MPVMQLLTPEHFQANTSIGAEHVFSRKSEAIMQIEMDKPGQHI